MGILGFILSACSCAWAQDPGWPRQIVKPGGKIIVYQPQVDDWQNFTDTKWRQAFQLTPAGGKAAGTSSAYGNTAAGKSSNGGMYAGHDGNVYKNTGSGWQKSNGSGGWSNVNTTQNQHKAQQNAQSYEQQHPSSQATAQQDKSNYQQQHPSSQASTQSMNQSRSSYGGSSENLDSEKQNRQSGSTQSQHYQSGNHSSGGYGGGGRSWGGGGGGSSRRR
jgi:hypothetical protein